MSRRPHRNPRHDRAAAKAARLEMKRAPSSAPASRARRSMLLVYVAVPCLVPMLVMLELLAWNLPIGETNRCVYRFSPWRTERAINALPALLVLPALSAGVIWLIVRPSRSRASGESAGIRPRWASPALTMAVIALTGVWSFFAPPGYLHQHAFNFISPAQDGAFVLEARWIPDGISAYLQRFPKVLSRTAAEAQGTRIISNPPGATALAWALREPEEEAPRPLARYLAQRLNLTGEVSTWAIAGLRLAAVLHLCWVLSGLLAYALGRQFLPPAGAALFSILVTVNPATLHFAPGKDVAQLLLVNGMLLAWFAGLRRGSSVLVAAAGAILAFSLAFTLLAGWVATIMITAHLWTCVRGATLWNASRPPQVHPTAVGHRALAPVVQFTVGAVMATALIYFATGLNLPVVLLTISSRFGDIQRELGYSRGLWLAIGLPIFLLFLSPVLITLAALGIRRTLVRRARARESGSALCAPQQPLIHAGSAGGRTHRREFEHGSAVLVCTLIAMLATYLLGVAYELPRLWIAFLPPLTLGLMIGTSVAYVRARSPGRAARLLMLLVAVHVAYSLAHWTLLDVRESEHRIMRGTIFRL